MTEAIQSDRQLLDEFRQHCKTLWPAIRFFGLCGADPHYVCAAMEIGRLLGEIHPESPQVNVEELARMQTKATIEDIANFVASAPEVRAKIGVGLQSQFAELIRRQAGG
jgi:hypothetical protein